MIFVDASALIAMVAQEPEARAFTQRLQEDRLRYCSAISLWETAAGLSHNYRYGVGGAREKVAIVKEILGLQIVSIGEREYELAMNAYADYGKGRHPAGLNLRDCFAYACAKAHRAALLFKGNDFRQTDVVCAL